MKKKKKILVFAMASLMVACAMILSAFTFEKQSTKNVNAKYNDECSWKRYRSNVPYCSGVEQDQGVCAGYGTVYIDTDTEQLAIKTSSSNPCNSNTNFYDLSETTKYNGYNYRFYMGGKYYYINISVPRSRYY